MVFYSMCIVIFQFLFIFFFFKQKTAYEMRISDWSSDVCSADLCAGAQRLRDRSHSHRGKSAQGDEAGRVRMSSVAQGPPRGSALDWRGSIDPLAGGRHLDLAQPVDRKSTRLYSSH